MRSFCEPILWIISLNMINVVGPILNPKWALPVWGGWWVVLDELDIKVSKSWGANR